MHRLSSAAVLPWLFFALPLWAQTDIVSTVRSLPLLSDPGTDIHYEGSIDKTGGNADWDWFLYEDERKEWVVLDVDGPGCIENLTQHRYFTASDPLFRFYIDGAAQPHYEVRLSEFGIKFPFKRPFADCYIGPYDNGRGPIRVIRSFAPVTFNKHCKVTTDVRLYGNNLQKGESGWGHIIYHTFAQPQEQTGTHMTENLEEVRLHKSHGLVVFAKDITEKKDVPALTVMPGEQCILTQTDHSGTLAAIRLFVDQADSILLQSTWVSIIFDHHAQPDVLCPLGAFFGNSLGLNTTEYLLMGTTTTGTLYNTFPMPFWESATMTVINKGQQPFHLTGGHVSIVPNDYPLEKTGYFRNTPYYNRKYTEGEDSRIGHVEGCGKIVAAHVNCWAERPGCISCEGDVHLYIDHERTPRLQSDGSESYVSYGWGFPTPPECHPFGGYDGLPDNPWSMTRLCILDYYPFSSDITFNIESGEHNNQYLEHSGTVFYYGQDRLREQLTDSICLTDLSSCHEHRCQITGEHQIHTGTSTYEGTFNKTTISKSYISYGQGSATTFDVTINPDNDGVRLLRTSNQQKPRQLAELYVDGQKVTERNWYHASSNEHMQWLDDSFFIPSVYTQGKQRITVTLRPQAVDGTIAWTDAKYLIYSYQK